VRSLEPFETTLNDRTAFLPAAAIQQEDLPTPAASDRPAPASPTVEIADDAESGQEPTEPFSTTYCLHGIISHLGTLASSGHFIADVFDTASEQWVRHDDSVVKVVRFTRC
jgi:ubiquitin C-terminal hydrolase